MELSSFSVEAMVRGYRVYRAIWEAAVGETLNCAREVGNRSDTFAVAVIKGGDTVGHVPRRISSICSIFMRNGGVISCEIIGSRGFSQDLPQGGLEVPCILEFVGTSKNIAKAKKLIDESLIDQASKINHVSEMTKQKIQLMNLVHPQQKKVKLIS